MDQWLANLTGWLVGLVKAFFTAIVTFFHDVALWVFDMILSAVAAVIIAVPVPAFISGGVNVGSHLAGFPAFSLYVLSQLNIGACLAVISAGITFRLLRKAGTLGQW